MKRSRDAVVRLDAGCDAGCGLCVATGPAPTEDPVGVARGGGGRLVIRGGRDAARALFAEAAGWREVLVHTHGAVVDGPTGVVVPIFSHVDAVHDRVAGPGSLARSLEALARYEAAGLRVEVEIPLLPRRLAHPVSILRRARAATSALRGVRFVVARGELPSALAPPAWPEGAALLAEALAFCDEAGIEASIARDDAIPFCALRDHPALLAEAFRFDPKEARDPARGCTRDACGACACREQCPGVADSYARAHGTTGITPFAARPEGLYHQRTSPLRVWTERERRAAKRTGLLVLRPTVNCNQDCLFCSANETSDNVWSSSSQILEQIARAARRGVDRLAFGGGEPTLAKDLPEWIAAARRLGVEEVELVTNGVLLDRAARVDALAAAGLTHAFVSLHAHDEALSKHLTQKIGDLDRTVRAIALLDGAGIKTAINHVIVQRNFRYLPDFVRFVHARFEGRVAISLAFVTPQYKALENLELVPRMSEVRPYVQEALSVALALGQPVWVGARQGLPPCQLGAFRAWSDVFEHADAGLSEDAPQKVRDPACDRCRYTEVCTGVWRPYAERYGTSELTPIEGPPFTGRERVAIAALKSERWGLPPSELDALPESLRDRAAEAATRASRVEPAPLLDAPFAPSPTRPLRVALLGSARRARALAAALRDVDGLTLDAVISPHAPEDFGACPTWHDAAEGLDAMRPDAVIVAAAPAAQPELVGLALARGIPVLASRPLARIELESAVIPAYELVHVPGTAGASAIVYRVGPDAPRTWSRRTLGPLLEDVLALAVREDANAELTSVTHRGVTRPETVALRTTALALELDFTVGEPRLTIRGEGEPTHVAPSATRELLAHFREVVAGRAAPLVDARRVVALARQSLDALETVGVIFERPTEPKHVASRALRERG